MDVLIVEDSQTARLQFERLLRGRGHRVTAVEDGEAAWALCRERSFPLILIDWMLPGIDGLELCRRIRALPYGARSVILITTANETPDGLVAALDAGASDYLTKVGGMGAIAVRLTVAERRVAELAARLAAEDARARSDARFRALTEATSDLVCILATDGSVLYESPSYARLLGVSLAALHRATGAPLNVIHPDDRERIRETYRHLVAGGGSLTVEFRHLLADGSYRMLESVVANRLADPAVGGIIVTSRDITDRTAAEMVLRASEASLRQLVEHAPIGMSICSQDGMFELVNPAYCSFFGYSREEMVGQPAAMVLAPPFRRSEVQIFAERTLENEGSGREWPVITRDGELRTVLGSGVTIPWADGAPRRVSFIMDITERKAAERHLTELALYDRLTGLPNRTLFNRRLESALARARQHQGLVAVLFADLDGFKEINDTHGHGVGDRVLQVVGGRLAGTVREGDTVARLGGDEFTAVLVELPHERIAVRVARKILASLDEVIDVGEHRMRIGASVGVALYPLHGEEIGRLMAASDAAMYAAKQAGKGQYACATERVDPVTAIAQ